MNENQAARVDNTDGSKFKKGQIINERYTVVRQLGVGGGGAVYACDDAETQQRVAVKLLLNRADLARFKRERAAQSKRRAQHIVSVLDAGMHEHLFYLVLELMNAGSLRDLLDGRKCSVIETAWLTEQIIFGLKEAKTVHRDLKPENILLHMNNGQKKIQIIPGDHATGVVAKVADFGLAKASAQSTSLTMSGQVMGTPAYMSPEQWKNAKRVSDKTDVYALGVMMVEMLTGKPPFRGKYAHELMNQHLEEAPNLAKVPAEVRDVLATCLDKKPGSRPTLNKLLAFVRAWQRAAVEEPGPATKRPTAKSKKQPRQKSHAKEDKREKAPPVARKKSNKHKPLKAPVAQQPSDQPASDDAGRAQGTVMFLCIASAIILLAAALIYFRDALVAWAR